jgi:hypothetical protein
MMSTHQLRIRSAIKANERRRAHRVVAAPNVDWRTFTIQLRPADYERIDTIAKSRNVPTSHVGREILLAFLARN